jgi:hypothetical protein
VNSKWDWQHVAKVKKVEAPPAGSAVEQLPQAPSDSASRQLQGNAMDTGEFVERTVIVLPWSG